MTGPEVADRPAVRIIRLCGDVDFADQGTLRTQLDDAVSVGAPIVVVLPYSASPLVRRTLLEIAPELADSAIVSSIRAASCALVRPPSYPRFPDLQTRLLALRASFWENAARPKEHRAA